MDHKREDWVMGVGKQQHLITLVDSVDKTRCRFILES